MSTLRRLVNLWRGRALDDEFDDELRFHFDMAVEANLRDGMTRDAADAAARRHLGSTLRAREGMREARVAGWLGSFWSDLGHSTRVFGRQPGLTAMAIVTLSLGIGANAAIFSLLYGLLLRPLPFQDPDRLVAIVDGFRAVGVSGVQPTVPELIDLRDWSRTLEGVSFYDTRDYQTSGGSEPARVFAARVEASLLSTLGVRPLYGRLFTDGENLPGRDRVVVLSHGLWRRTFGADSGVVGREIIVNGVSHTVIGVAPADFTLDYLAPEPIEMFVPFSMTTPYTSRGAEFANVRRVVGVARLKPGVSHTQASAELAAFSTALAGQYPALYRRGSDGQDLGFFVDSEPLHDLFTARAQPVLMLLVGAVALVLLLACVNTGQFLVARAIEREGEVAIRSALGASRARLLRQFLAESIFLAAAAGALALLQAAWLLRTFEAIVPGGQLGDARLDTPVLLFTAGTALAVTLACGLCPARHLSRANARRSLHGRVSAPPARLRQALMAVEVGVSMVLLATAGLLLDSLRELQTTPGGYSSDGVMVMRMRAPARVPGGGGAIGGMYEQYLERIAAMPGIDAAAVADVALPGMPGVDFAIEGRPDDAATLSRQTASYQIVSSGYFSVLRIPVKEGRAFASEDRANRPPVAVINEELARRFWPGQSAIGQRIRSGPGPRSALMTIVGVVGNVRPIRQTGAVPQIYVSSLQQSEPIVSLLVRPAAGAIVPIETVKRALWSVSPDQPVFEVQSMADLVDRSVAGPRTIAALLGSFALLAVCLSVGGVYTLVLYVASRRTKELALRRAIGATARDVLLLLAGPTFRWILVGLLAGLAGAVAATGAVRAAVSGIVELDPYALAVIGVLYLATVTLAMCTPAFRALRHDPGTILRAE